MRVEAEVLVGWLVGFVSRHNNHFGSFNAGSNYFDKNFVLVLFVGISNIIGYLMPNPFLYI